MTGSVMTSSPGFISIGVSDVDRSAAFYERYLGGNRDTFDYGPRSAVFVGWPTLRPQFPTATAARPAARRNDLGLVARERCPGTVRTSGRGRSPDPRGAVRWAVRPDVRNGRSGWLPHHDLRARSTPLLATEGLTPAY